MSPSRLRSPHPVSSLGHSHAPQAQPLRLDAAATPRRFQTLCFSHVLKWIGFHGTLLAEPLAIACGLVIAIVQPGLLSIAVCNGM